jgi:hypothetical protein
MSWWLRGEWASVMSIEDYMGPGSHFPFASGILDGNERSADGERDERKRNDALRNTLAEAQSAADVARGQYRAGLVDITPVLTAQGTVLDAQNQLAQSDGSLDRDLVSLYKALGGGWKQ